MLPVPPRAGSHSCTFCSLFDILSFSICHPVPIAIGISEGLFYQNKKHKQIDPKNIYKMPVCCHHLDARACISLCLTKESFDQHYY